MEGAFSCAAFVDVGRCCRWSILLYQHIPVMRINSSNGLECQGEKWVTPDAAPIEREHVHPWDAHFALTEKMDKARA